MGMWIVIEGPDASGKTTIANALSKKIKAQNLSLPNNFWIKPKDIPSETFYPKMVQEFAKQVKLALPNGNIVSARSAFSIPPLTYAYGNVKIPVPETVIKPDILVYLRPTWKVLRERIKERVKHGMKPPLHEENEELYKKLCDRYQEILSKHPNILIIDNSNITVDDTVDQILKARKIWH